MGGKAFVTQGKNGEPALKVPRMSPAVYAKMKLSLQKKLEELYIETFIPFEAPGAADHGDIDFLVQCPMDPYITIQKLADILEAERHLVRSNAETSFAVRHPTEPDAFIQVDVNEVQSELWEWAKFRASYSDLFMILGVLHRELGLIMDVAGLSIQIEEIEPYDTRLCRMPLTTDPRDAMAFLGLDIGRYYKGFREEAVMFEWVAKSRFFNTTLSLREERTQKSSDRKRLQRRAMYRRFMEEWLPAHPDVGNKKKIQTRKQVLQSALIHFKAHSEYKARIREHTLVRREANLWDNIGARISASTKSKKIAIKGLKHFVQIINGQPSLASKPLVTGDLHVAWVKDICQNDTLFTDDHTLILDSKDVKMALDWVEQNWEQAKALEKQYPEERKGSSG